MHETYAIRVPTANQLVEATEAFDLDWGAVDDVLYGICRQYPDHANRRGLIAKLALINRAYSAGPRTARHAAKGAAGHQHHR